MNGVNGTTDMYLEYMVYPTKKKRNGHKFGYFWKTKYDIVKMLKLFERSFDSSLQYAISKHYDASLIADSVNFNFRIFQ